MKLKTFVTLAVFVAAIKMPEGLTPGKFDEGIRTKPFLSHLKLIREDQEHFRKNFCLG